MIHDEWEQKKTSRQTRIFTLTMIKTSRLFTQFIKRQSYLFSWMQQSMWRCFDLSQATLYVRISPFAAKTLLSSTFLTHYVTFQTYVPFLKKTGSKWFVRGLYWLVKKCRAFHKDRDTWSYGMRPTNQNLAFIQYQNLYTYVYF